MSVEPAAIHTTLRQQILTKKDMANSLLFRNLQGTSDIDVCISILIKEDTYVMIKICKHDLNAY